MAQDWYQGVNFTARMVESLDSFSQTSKCGLTPDRALAMTEAELREYANACFRVGRFKHAQESVPVFQLALFLRAFEGLDHVRWTFLEHERLTGEEGQRDLAALVQRLGLRRKDGVKRAGRNGQACQLQGGHHMSFSRSGGGRTQQTFDRPRLESLFEPWFRQLKQLALRSQKTHDALVLLN